MSYLQLVSKSQTDYLIQMKQLLTQSLERFSDKPHIILLIHSYVINALHQFLHANDVGTQVQSNEEDIDREYTWQNKDDKWTLVIRDCAKLAWGDHYSHVKTHAVGSPYITCFEETREGGHLLHVFQMGVVNNPCSRVAQLPLKLPDHLVSYDCDLACFISNHSWLVATVDGKKGPGRGNERVISCFAYEINTQQTVSCVLSDEFPFQPVAPTATTIVGEECLFLDSSGSLISWPFRPQKRPSRVNNPLLPQSSLEQPPHVRSACLQQNCIVFNYEYHSAWYMLSLDTRTFTRCYFGWGSALCFALDTTMFALVGQSYLLSDTSSIEIFQTTSAPGALSLGKMKLVRQGPHLGGLVWKLDKDKLVAFPFYDKNKLSIPLVADPQSKPKSNVGSSPFS